MGQHSTGVDRLDQAKRLRELEKENLKLKRLVAELSPGVADLGGGGPKVPQKQRPRRRLWLNDGSCVRRRPEHTNHVWSYDFMTAMTHDGRSLRPLTLLDEFSCEVWRFARHDA